MIQSFMHVRQRDYSVKEIFYTLQGEGANAGRAAVFLRFAGCNLWSGREPDRSTAACRFCDTDFVGGTRYPDAARLGLAVRSAWPGTTGRFVVVTGGEPALQLDRALVLELHALRFEVAVETNGTRPLPAGIDWVTVSPKAGTEIVTRTGDELKVVWPQALDLDELAGWGFPRRYLQPMDGPDKDLNTRVTVEMCLRDPRWRLSTQTHKAVGIR